MKARVKKRGIYKVESGNGSSISMEFRVNQEWVGTLKNTGLYSLNRNKVNICIPIGVFTEYFDEIPR